MIRFPIPLLVLLAGCAPIGVEPTPTCYTPCGLAAFEGNCPELQAYETLVVRTLARSVRVWREEKICDGLKTYRLVIHPHNAVSDVNCSPWGWHTSSGPYECISGLTQFEPRIITIEHTDWRHSALAHEIAHVAEEANTGGRGHCRWGDPHLLNAIHELTGEVDPAGPGPECPK